eukprot:TRINITY_DN66684_c0_g1_i1.p3 TRINITY_DN66684_c0_g1~~TRINITY_DN66684_c0_g1_i1.p3  ORF type:complete len:138 (-),score=42.02 TRINITY_DN66684_c0_g1_i1:81-494(-)
MFFFKQKTAYEMQRGLVGSEMCIRDRYMGIVFVELPEVGDSFEKGDECATLESVKAVSEMYCPVSGEVVEINEALEDEPGLINEDPYEKGWMFKVKVTSADGLMDKAAYLEMLKGAQKCITSHIQKRMLKKCLLPLE